MGTGTRTQREGTSVATRESSLPVTRDSWDVVVWNDPVTPMKVVVVIFKRIFGYANNRCTQLMLTVHHEGRAVVWTGAHERAESYVAKLQAAGLRATVERSGE